MNDPITTFLIVLLAAVGVISLRRVWRKLREHENWLELHNARLQNQSWKLQDVELKAKRLAERITQLENERKD